MSKTRDFFDPKIVFSSKNPLLIVAGQAHHRVFEAFDRTSRVQLSLAEDLLDMNRKRFEALYAGDGFMDKIAAHQNLATAAGKRTATWAGDLQEIVVDLGSRLWDAANEFVPGGKAETPRSKSGKKGAHGEK
jgi:hypothetical protein